MHVKKNILEICNGLWLWWTEKTMQIFCKYLDKTKYNVFACGIFKWWERAKLIESHVSNLLIANWNIDEIKDFINENNIDIVHWHSISQNAWNEFEKSIELLKFLKSKNIRVIETSPFSLYNEEVDSLLDLKLFVSKTNLIKYFWKFGKKINDKSKYSFLYNPLDTEELEKLRLNDKEKILLRSQYWISKTDFVIWKVWRANLWKWEDTIINIVPDLIKTIPNLKVVIRAIPEIKKKKIKKMWIEAYFIYLPETVSEKEISETYQLMDVMVHTSRIWECNSVAINEWLFFSIPIITTSTDFLQFTLFGRDNWQIEVIRDNINWFVSNQIIEIIKFIITLNSDKLLLETIKNNSKNKSIFLFDSTNITKQLESFIENWNKNLYDLDHELKLYKKNRKKVSIFSLFKINIEAIYEKFINKA